MPKTKFLLLPHDEFNRLESKYGYTSKSELQSDAKDKMTMPESGGEVPVFHVVAIDSDLQGRITPKKPVKRTGSNVNDQSRDRAEMH